MADFYVDSNGKITTKKKKKKSEYSVDENGKITINNEDEEEDIAPLPSSTPTTAERIEAILKERAEKKEKENAKNEEEDIAPLPPSTSERHTFGKDTPGQNSLTDRFNSKTQTELEKFVTEGETPETLKKDQDDKGLKFFKGGAFSDGFDFLDIVKAPVATAADIATGIVQGLAQMGEGVADLGYFVGEAATDLLGDGNAVEEWFDEKKDLAANWNLMEDAFGNFRMKTGIQRNSLLDRTSQAVTQGIGQAVGTFATAGAGQMAGLGKIGQTILSSGLMFSSSAGGGMSEAHQSGASDEEALIYGAAKGVIDAGTEMIFGALGKGTKAVGVSKGLSSFDDQIASALSSKISNRVVKTLVQAGVKASAEGVEELLAGVLGGVAKKLTYMDDESIWKIWEDENLLEQFVVGALSAGFMQGGDVNTSIKTDSDLITDLNRNEEAVVNKELENRVAEQEKKDGKKLSNKAKNEIYESILKDMDKGYISTDTIEEVLGGETYKSYQDTVKNEDALVEQEKTLRDEFNTLNRLKTGDRTGEQTDRLEELRSQLSDLTTKIEDSKNNSQRDWLQRKYKSEVEEVARGSRLQESYNERARRGQAFTADLSKYNEKQKAVVQKAIDSGILNNTNRTHELVDFISKISADKGVSFDFTNNEKLKESGFAIDGKTVNGYITKDGIVLNMNSSKVLQSTVGHEITHVLEGTELYTELQNAIINYAKLKGDYQGRLDTLTKLYEGVEGADINAELTADLVGDYLFQDADFVNNLSTKHRNVFQKIYDEIKYLVKTVTAGSKEARELEKVKHVFEQAYRAQNKAQTDTKYSLSETTDGRIAAVVDSDILSNIDTSTWDNTKKEAAKKAASEALKQFADGIVVDGITRKVNKKSRDEYTRSNYTESLYRTSPDVFADKMRAAEVADDIVVAATNWSRDGGLKHPRSDGFVDFDHGHTLIVSGNAKYSAEVVVGITADGEAVLYDVVDMTPTTFDIKNAEPSTAATTQNAPGAIHEDSAGGIVPQTEGNVNTNFSLSEEQQDYFKDSVVRDENGNLLKVYHGSKNSGFNVFKYDPNVQTGTDYGEAYYFTSDRQKASGYSYDVTKDERVAQYKKDKDALRDKFLQTRSEEDKNAFLNYKLDGKSLDDLMSDENYLTDGGEVKEVYLNITNPLIVDAGGKYYYEVYPEYFKQARANGNDGIIVKNVIDNPRGEARPIDTYIAFEPNQIKSVSNTNPTSNPDIRFSLSEADNTYLDAVKRGDMETAQRMVYEAAQKAGYTTDTSWKMQHTAPNAKDDVSLFDLKESGLVPDDYWDHPEWYTYSPEERSSFYKVKDAIQKQERWTAEGKTRYDGKPLEARIWVYRAVDKTFNSKEDHFRNGDWVTPSLEYAVNEGQMNPNGYRIIKANVSIKDLYWDGNSIAELGYDDGKNYAYADTKNNRKLLDPVTYDEFGLVIPLSKRFNKRSDDVRRSLSKNGDTPKTYGNFATPARDLLLETAQEDIAPMQETTENVQESVKTPTENVQEMFPDDYAPLSEDEGATEERLASLNESDVPPEMEAPYYEEEEAPAPADPFENRDIKEVGNRKVKAYMYENPEVKPFFQEEANIMLGELNDTVKGERIYTETDLGSVWTGTSRYTSDDVAYLRDSLGYSYADIEKGLNAIIEDNGKENIAVAKRIEFILNDRLTKGYTDFRTGMEIPANQDYVNLLNEKQITDYSREAWDSFVATADQYAPPMEEDIAPVVQRAPVTEEYEAIRPRRQAAEPVPMDDDIAPIGDNVQYGDKLVRTDTERPGEKRRKWVGTSTESKPVKGKVLPGDLNQDTIHYQPISNKTTLGNANARLGGMGYDASLQYFNSQFANKKISLDDIALGERLIQEAVKRGDTKTAGELIQNVAILGTELGQKVQALSIIKRLTPEGQLGMLTKVVERGKTKGDKAYEGVELTQEMKDEILSVYGKDGTYDQKKLNEAVEKVKKKIADQMKVTKMDKVNAWRYLSMLGNPKTHIRNFFSNVAMKGTVAVKNVLARTIETVAPIQNRTKTWRAASDEVKAFAKQTAISMKEELSDGGKYNEDASIKAKRQIFKNKILNGVYEFNNEWLSKEDWWFSKSAFQNSLGEYLTANGIRTEADIQAHPEIVEKAKQYATEQAQIATFQQYSYLANKLSELEHKNAVFNAAVGSVMPFKKTPINIAKTGLNYSPLGFAKTLTYDIAQVKNGKMEASELVDHLSQNITGSALTLVGYMLAHAGLLSGGGEDDKEGEYDYQLGEQSYSVNIGGKSYSLSWLSPVAMPLFVGANAYEQLVEGKEWNGDVVVETLAQTLDPLSEMSFLSGLNQVLSSYDNGMEKFAGIFESMTQNYVTQFVPTLSSQVATVMDDTKRSTKVAADSDFKFFDETINKLKLKIPGLRETLEPTTDIWGNDIKLTDDTMTRAFETFIAPYSVKENIATEIDAEIKALYRQTGDNGIIPSIPYNYVNYKDEKYEMSAKDYPAFKKTYGQTAYHMMEDLFDTSTYQNASAEERADLVNKVYDYARDLAKKNLLASRGVTYTNATKDDVEYYKENPIKGAIEHDMMPDEYSFFLEYPEKYAFFDELGITYADYAAADEDGKRAYTWAYENPDKYQTSKAITSDFMEYYQYKSDMGEFNAKDAYGNSVSGLKKERVAAYISGLDLEYGRKLLLFKSQYPSDDSYNREIIEYLDSRSDISYEEMVTILTELGFKVNGNTVTWD